ncbi:biosynthetic-type acetolactate synthase large subunit [Nakamurella leprariae]|uniref:biosynthetic-type acetolactate synthase large subunit n=1 Tax=Nakamurella leprariae TaxID=2803911 RepID=UPI0038B283C6
MVDSIEWTGAGCLLAALEAAGVTTVFAIPDCGPVLPVSEASAGSSRIRQVRFLHEQGAGHAAEGYALATGRVGVCMASGAGVTSLITPLTDAAMDSVPVVAITIHQDADDQAGNRVLHGIDVCAMTMPVTKHNFLVTETSDIAPTIAQAFHIASTGRPGPVVVDIASSALIRRASYRWPDSPGVPGYETTEPPTADHIRAAAELIHAAHRPVLYVGGGVIRSGAARALRELVDRTQLPVVTTLMARGALPDSHPRNLGMPGMHGTVPAVVALQLSDLVIALGARFDDRVTGDRDSFAPDARVIHVDIDPAEIGKNRAVDVPIVGDCRRVLEELAGHFDQTQPAPDLSAWHRRLDSLRERYPLGFEQPPDGPLSPQYVLQRLGELVGGPDTVFTSGVGQHQMWASQFIAFEHPSTWLNSGGLGTMGFGVPAAMGAKLGRPEATVWCIDGDGCFQMTGRELATCALEGIAIKVALINNGGLGMVRQLQTLYYDERINNVDLTSRHPLERVPDFVRFADALGCVGLSCDTPEEVDVVIAKAMAINDAPVVIDFRVDAQALVWPSIAAGASNEDIQYARGLAPAFAAED